MIDQDRAQAYFQRQRDAYWAAKNAPPAPVEVKLDNTITGLARLLGGGGNNRAAARSAGRYQGASRSQKHKPARPSEALLREARIREARRQQRAAARAHRD